MSTTKNGKPSIYFSPTIKSPAGSALFAKLEEPDVFKGGEPTWKITLVFNENDAEYIKLIQNLNEFAASFSKECGRKIDGSSIIRPDKTSGKPSITFKAKAKQGDDGKFVRIPIVDADKAPVDREPWNGDTCRVAFKFGGWTSPFGAGIKPYLSAVQVIERRPKGASSGFNAVDVFDGPMSPDEEVPF